MPQDTETDGKRRRSGRASRFLMRFLTLTVAAIVLAVLLAPLIVEWLITTSIESAGLIAEAVDVRSVGLNQTVIAKLSVLDTASETRLTMSEAAIDYAPGDLMAGTVRAVKIEEVSARGRIGAQEPGLDALIRRLGAGVGTGVMVGGVPNLDIVAFDAVLKSPIGTLRSRFGALISSDAGVNGFSYRIRDGLMTAEDFDASLADINAMGSLRLEPEGAVLSVERLTGQAKDQLRPQRFSALQVSVRAQSTGSTIGGDGSIADGQGRTVAMLNGRYDLAQDAGRIDFDSGTLRFGPAGLQPQKLAPVLKELIKDVRGSARFKGSVSLGATGIAESSGVLEVDDLAGSNPIAEFSGISGSILFDSLLPLISKPAQTLAIGHINLGLPLDDGSVNVHFMPGRRLKVTDLTFPWSGGHLVIREAVWPMGTPLPDITLDVEEVSLAEFFEMLDVEGLIGTGSVSGSLPVTVKDGNALVRGGRLEAPAGGTLRYKGARGEIGTAAGEQGEIVFQALEDFRYDSLTIDVDGELNGDMTVRLQLKGANPALFEGYPIELNVSVESALVELLKQGITGARVFEIIREQRGP